MICACTGCIDIPVRRRLNHVAAAMCLYRLWAPYGTTDTQLFVAQNIARLILANRVLHEFRYDEPICRVARWLCVCVWVTHTTIATNRVSRVHFSKKGWCTIVDALCGKGKSRLPSFGVTDTELPRSWIDYLGSRMCVSRFTCLEYVPSVS